MGGGSFVSNGTHDEDSSCLNQDFPFLSSHSSTPRGNQGLQDKDKRVNEKNGLDSEVVCKESAQTSSTVDIDVCERKGLSIYEEILQSYDELKIDSKNLNEAKEKILSYRPGRWIEKAKGLKLSDYDVPETTCLILIGPSRSGKSSLINRISKVFHDDKFAPARAQVSWDGTYFLREYMIPRDSNSICLYDTRGLSDIDNEHNKMLKNWMTKGVRHGAPIIRSLDNQRLRNSLKFKGDNKGFFSTKNRKVNFVVFVLNGLSVLNVMENAAGTSAARYIEAIVSTFNCPFLSFKDDKPVLVFTHGDLLSLSDRARVRAYLGELLGIPPTKQIFDIPDCDDLVTESAIIGMLRYTLEHADRNIPQKSNVMNKVHKLSLSLFMILLILGIGFAIGLEQIRFMHQYHAPQPQACSIKVHEMHPNLKFHEKEPKIEPPKLEVPEKEPMIEHPNMKVSEKESRIERPKMKVHEKEPKIERSKMKIPEKEPKIERLKIKVPEKELKIEWHKIRHIW